MVFPNQHEPPYRGDRWPPEVVAGVGLAATCCPLRPEVLPERTVVSFLVCGVQAQVLGTLLLPSAEREALVGTVELSGGEAGAAVLRARRSWLRGEVLPQP